MHIIGFMIVDMVGIDHQLQGFLGSRMIGMPSCNGEMCRDICESI